jgi:hypothetical protein
MKVATELSLFLENKPGVLADVCADLKKKKINIEAISVVDHIDHALVRMVVSEPRKAVHTLEAAGCLVLSTEVLQVDLPNRLGALGDIAGRLGRAKVNIDYLYGTVGDGAKASLFLRVDDVRRAGRALAR